jgi:hypothetical protein
MSEDATKDMPPLNPEVRVVLAAIAALRAEVNRRFGELEARLEKLEAKTTPLESLLEELVRGQREMRLDLSDLKGFIFKTVGDHEHRIRHLEELQR